MLLLTLFVLFQILIISTRRPKIRINSAPRQKGNSSSDDVCSHGFKLGQNNSTCEDIDECLNNDACASEQLCTNFVGGYNCTSECASGYTQIDRNCQDIDECANPYFCSEYADCVNKIGSFECRCHGGYKKNPENNMLCLDINECTEPDSISGPRCPHGCYNFYGGYSCSCPEGYQKKYSDNGIKREMTSCQFGIECKTTGKQYKCVCITCVELGQTQSKPNE